MTPEESHVLKLIEAAMPACLSGIEHQSALKHIGLKYISQWHNIKYIAYTYYLFDINLFI
jgi:hypothetical protein